MKLAFYKVSNSKDYERHTFDYIYDKPQEILKMLRKLKSDEWIMYDLTETSRSTMYPTLGDFEEDYNDEMLDGGWWSVIIRDYQTEDEKQTETKIRDEYNRISENEDYVHIDDMTAFAKDVLVDILDDDKQDDNVCYDFEDELHQELQNLIVRLGVKYKNKMK